MADGGVKSGGGEGAVDEVHVAVESDAVGAGDDVDGCWHGKVDGGAGR